ncbi:MAG: hypothetical protein NXI22_14640 [bacterium]|nr:hypothetical protein [bacterium]
MIELDDLPVVKLAPEQPFPAGSLPEEEANEVRAHHEAQVEEWLDECDFLTELFALHAKYGIEPSEEGYRDYRTHLRLNYNTKIAVLGPTTDPLSEGCDCIFCRLHPLDQPVEEEPEQKPEEEPKQESEPQRPIRSATRCPQSNRSRTAPAVCRRRQHRSPKKFVGGELTRQSCRLIAKSSNARDAKKKGWDFSQPKVSFTTPTSIGRGPPVLPSDLLCEPCDCFLAESKSWSLCQPTKNSTTLILLFEDYFSTL